MPEDMTNTASDTEAVNPTEVVDNSPTVPISEGVSRDNDASDDAILDRLMGEKDAFEAAVDPPTPEPGQSTESQEETVEAQDDTTSEDEDTETRSEPMSEEYEKAIAALRRDGVPESALENMDDSSILEWGTKRAKNQADVDGYGAKVKELEDKLNSAQSADGSEETSEGAGTDQAQAQPETTKELNQYKDRISDLFGDEAAEAVMSPIRDLVQQTKQILEDQRQAIASIQSDQQVRTLTETRSRLQERFPRLADDTDFGKVVEGMQKLAAIGEYDNIDELMTDSYRVNFAKLAEQEAKKAQVDRMKDGGQPTTQSQSSAPARSKGGEEREDAALDALLSGKGYDGALSAYQG